MKVFLFIFFNLFALTVGGMMLILRFHDKRTKKKLVEKLGGVEKRESATVVLLRELKQSSADPFRKALQSLNVTGALEEMLQQADIDWPVARLMKIMGATACLGLFAGAVFPVLANRAISMLAFGSVGGAAPFLYVRRARNKRMAAIEKQLPDAMDFLARSMRAGHAFTISVGMVGDDLPEPLGREFRSLFNEQNLGAPIEVAFESFQKRIPLSDVRLFCSAATLQRRTGGNLSEILSRLSELVRDRFRLRGQVQAASAHGRMTAGILTAMPILTMVGLMAVAPDYLQGMWNDSDGRMLVAGSVVAQLLGNFTIRKIVRIKV